MATEERIQKAVQHNSEVFRELAETQATRTIGETAVALHQQGHALTTQGLIAALLAPVQDQQPGHLQRVQHEAAARLLGWHPGPAGG